MSTKIALIGISALVLAAVFGLGYALGAQRPFPIVIEKCEATRQTVRGEAGE